MRLPPELLFLLSLADPITASPTLEKRSASFQSLRGLTLLTADYSNHESYTAPTKFFHESTFSPHYDGRFASTELPHHTRLFHMRLMLKSYIETMDRIGVRTWLMHGCLLGWWWNGRIMPWDTDVDVMVDEPGMNELGSWWNMSVHHFSASELGLVGDEPGYEHAANRHLHDEVAESGKRYLLEVNPWWTNLSTTDRENVIDARWIDTGTGLFIDVTTVHVQPVIESSPTTNTEDMDGEEDDIPLYTKDQHAYTSTTLFPLRQTTFESIPVHIPYDYQQLLLDEYGAKALTHSMFKDFKFKSEVAEWVMVDSWGEEVAEEDEEEVMRRLKAARERMDYLERVEMRGKEREGRFGDAP